MNRFGVIDIGTNSVRLMCATADGGDVTSEMKLSQVVHTGEGVHETGRLSSAAIERTAGAVRQFLRITGELALPVYCFATSATRDAENRQELLDKIDIDVRILSGEEEALCGFYGALPAGEGAIVDVGGGSTEVVRGSGGSIEQMASINAGCVRARDIFAPGGTLGDVCAWAAELFSPLACEAEEYTALGGTATSLAAVHHGLEWYDVKRTHGTVLEHGRVRQLAEALFAGTANIAAIQPARAAVLPYGAGVLLGFMEAVGAKRLRVSEQDNLEGFARRYIGERHSAADDE